MKGDNAPGSGSLEKEKIQTVGVQTMTRFGLLGCGAMGSAVAQAFVSGEIPRTLSCVYDVRAEAAEELAQRFKDPPRICESIGELIENSDFIIEAASQEAVREHMPAALKAERDVLIMSVGALLDDDVRDKVYSASKESSASIYLPSGALAGVDGMLSGAVVGVDAVTLTTTKPPGGLRGVAYLKQRGVDVERLAEPTVVFEGSAVEAARLFPKNINVSAVASLASGRTANVRIVCDPDAERNTHEICATGPFGEVTAKTTNLPSPDNPKTSYLAALSVIATLKKITGNIKIGN
ncbi:MAG: aspartate dehydrogenase [Candidatus Altiarchaeales archaeon]|nr:aspartate dehydrogenase [Candidatus Altiarchaeales archaeon]MBD3416752.1 aspartate dehydrogenase [Candidatus Altiarchaeales archaeon]